MPASHVANSLTFKVTTPSDREITLTRLFDAPRELVFDAMTKPEHVRRWWGNLDDRHAMTVCEIDLRPGGAWRWVGQGPGGEYAFSGVYKEILRPELLVYTEIFEPHFDGGSLVTQVLTEEEGKTRLTVINTQSLGDTSTTDFWVAQLLIAVERWRVKNPESW